MSKKRKTNKQVITALINDLDKTSYGVGTALLRERLLKIAEITLNDIKNNSEAWDNGFVNSNLYTDLCERINKHCGFEETTANDNQSMTLING